MNSEQVTRQPQEQNSQNDAAGVESRGRRDRCQFILQILAVIVLITFYIITAVESSNDVGQLTYKCGRRRGRWYGEWTWYDANGTDVCEISADWSIYRRSLGSDCHESLRNAISTGAMMFWCGPISLFAVWFPIFLGLQWAFRYPLTAPDFCTGNGVISKAFAASVRCGLCVSLLGSLLYIIGSYQMKNHPTVGCSGMISVQLGSGPPWMISFFFFSTIGLAIWLVFRVVLALRDDKNKGGGAGAIIRSVLSPVPREVKWDAVLESGRLYGVLWTVFIVFGIALFVPAAFYSTKEAVVLKLNTTTSSTGTQQSSTSNGVEKIITLGGLEDSGSTWEAKPPQDFACFWTARDAIRAGSVIFSFLGLPSCILGVTPITLLCVWIWRGTKADAAVKLTYGRIVFYVATVGWSISLLGALIYMAATAHIFTSVRRTHTTASVSSSSPCPEAMTASYKRGFILVTIFFALGSSLTVCYLCIRFVSCRSRKDDGTTKPTSTAPPTDSTRQQQQSSPSLPRKDDDEVDEDRGDDNDFTPIDEL